MTVTAPYGSWKSPITSESIVTSRVGLGGLTRGESGVVYWTESRPQEQGRTAVVRRARGGALEDLLPPPWNARTRVHEYGGTSYLIHNSVLYFSNFADQRVYRLDPGATEPQPITPAADLRYVDYQPDDRRDRLICVREDHTASDREAANTIVALDWAGRDVADGGVVLVSGNDFYSNPRLSPDGSRLAWLTWNHPNMPWDGVELWVADVAPYGGLASPRRVAGGLTESVFQPEWGPDGRLYFVADPDGWWNLYRWDGEGVTALHPMQAEFGEPQWVFGMHTYAFEGPRRIVCSYIQQGVAHLATLDTRTLAFTPYDLPYTDISDVTAAPGYALFIAGSPVEPWSVIALDLASRQTTVLKRSSDLEINPAYLSIPRTLEFPTTGGLTAYGFFYPPTNGDFTAPSGELPPLLVKSHGGPTSATTTTLNPGIQYWTSRGVAVLDVNYGGSSGYGRAYRDRLKGQWGIMDVDDCTNGALYLADTGQVDRDRLAIEGGSAGGYTTLCALTFRKAFKAGASHFGVSDAEALAKDTHKFESHYLDSMIGPYPAARDVYVARSPIHFVDQMECALILFQGADDRVVPPDQARTMFEALRRRGYPVAYLEFPGEGHGFRRAENIRRSLDGELYFFSQIFGFTPADPIQPVPIENWDTGRQTL